MYPKCQTTERENRENGATATIVGGTTLSVLNRVNAHKKIKTMDKSKFIIQSLPEIIVAAIVK